MSPTVLEQIKNQGTSCGAKRRNSFLGFVSYPIPVKDQLTLQKFDYPLE
jgi:hypothetical protein